MMQNTPKICNRCKRQPAMETTEVCVDCYLLLSREDSDLEESDERSKMSIPRRSRKSDR